MIQSFKSIEETNANIKPFLKWAGGKGQLLDAINRFLPPELENDRITRYKLFSI